MSRSAWNNSCLPPVLRWLDAPLTGQRHPQKTDALPATEIKPSLSPSCVCEEQRWNDSMPRSESTYFAWEGGGRVGELVRIWNLGSEIYHVKLGAGGK